MTTTGYLGKCSTKSCRHATRVADYALSAECPEHGRYRLEPIWGETVADIKCGASCRNATGPSCDCSCGGHNHGMGHAG
jgi:hypothetical protein